MAERIVSHYAIERSLGAGGMGEVFLARDLALGRPVALKLVTGPVGAAALERFRREAEACARVQHPAIATFYEAGEGDGVAFLAMEFVPGETLRSRLVRGRLEAAGALTLADALLEGLTHAHAAGVLHRDIKPENVMVCDDGGAKLLDFGIARLLDDPSGGAAGEDATAVALTEEGSVLGTLGYMSPEQLKAQPLDERSDVFSLAATLYEALSGRPAFPGRTPGERVAAILSGDGPPLEPDAIPAELAPVLRRALARDREARYASAAAFLADVRSAASGEYVAALPDSVAVLDFQNLSASPEDAWIGSGIAESVGADLAGIDGLTVVPRDTVVKARSSLGSPGSAAEPVELGHALGCRWVLAGAYQRAGDSLRVTSRLTEVSTRSVVASEKLDGRLDEIFSIQDRLAQSVAERLRRTRGEGERRPAPTKKLEAYEAHARGRRFFFRLEKGGLDQARQLYEDALRADPHHAPALGDLAAVHAMRYTFTTDARELALARGYAERAIRADPEAGGPRIWLAYVCWRQGRADEAVEHARRAAELAPADPFGPYFAGCALSAGRRWAESIPLFQGALAADEQHGWSWLGLGWAQLETGKRVEARWCLEKAVALERLKARHPTAGVAGYLGEFLRREGDLDGARSRCLEALDALERSDFMYRDSFRGVALCTLGRTSLERNDAVAARAAFQQAAAHLKGRPHGLGEGHLLVQALAGLARVGRLEGANDAPSRLDEALGLFRERRTHNFDWLWLCTDEDTRRDLRLAEEESSADVAP